MRKIGYYSEVRIYIEEDDDYELEDIIKGAEATEEIYFFDNYQIGKNNSNKRVLFVKYESIKWYPDFPLVKYWENILSKLEENKYLFTELGEDDREGTILGSYGDAYVVSYFEYDVDFIE